MHTESLAMPWLKWTRWQDWRTINIKSTQLKLKRQLVHFLVFHVFPVFPVSISVLLALANPLIIIKLLPLSWQFDFNPIIILALIKVFYDTR